MMNKRPVGRPRVHPGRVLTNAERCRAYRTRLKRRQRPAYFSQKKDLWETNPDDFAAWHAEFGFTLDVCALPEKAKCPRYFTPADDGLQQDWGRYGRRKRYRFR